MSDKQKSSSATPFPAFMLKAPGSVSPMEEILRADIVSRISSYLTSSPERLWSARLSFGIRQGVGGRSSICTSLLCAPSSEGTGNTVPSRCATGTTLPSLSQFDAGSLSSLDTPQSGLECLSGNPEEDDEANDWID